MPRKKTLPVNAPRSELHTDTLKIADAPDGDIEQRSEIVKPADKQPLTKEYLAALAFNEELITIMIEPSDEENAPVVVDCWCNGKGAEVMNQVTGKMEELSCLPIGQPIVTKRKYVEILARSRTDRVSTNKEVEHPMPGQDGFKMRRQSTRRAVFSVLDDKNPKGREWLMRLHAER